jgi:hemoglobin-like flavoprotein
MDAPTTVNVQAKRGAEDSGRYFKYMAEFVGLTPADADIIQQTKPIIEKHLPDIVAKFYAHLLRYPPTRKFFLKKDHSIDQDYVELRMRHLTNFWLRTASGIYDDDYARYIDYVGRAHTSHGADPHIYIAERYVIGQVGFVQHAIGEALIKELRHVDEDMEASAMEAWDKLLMVILEMLARAYGHEREAETFDALVPVDSVAVDRLAIEAFELEHDAEKVVPHKDVVVARAADIPEGERKIVQVDGLSIGVFHHEGKWYALRNSCLHRGGPVATGRLDGDTLTVAWLSVQRHHRTVARRPKRAPGQLSRGRARG